MLSLRRLATASILALLLVGAVPVEATPSLQKGAHSTYSLNVTISFLETCETLGTTTAASSLILCPMMAAFPISTSVNGTVAWSVTDLSDASALLNVTHDLTVSSAEANRPTIRNLGSFNDSIDLASRLVSFFPGIMPETDQFLQMSQTNTFASLSGINLTSSITALEGFVPHRSLYTMWWVNGPLKLNETVPVLVLPTNVTRSSNVDLGGSIGDREAWTLDFNFSRPMTVPDPSAAMTPIPSLALDAGVAFNYDKTSDLLLSATAELHSGVEEVFPIPPSSCIRSATMACPATSGPTMILGNFGLDIQASLKLTSTNLDLSQRMTPTAPPRSNGGSDDGNGPGTNTGTSSGSKNNGAGSDTSGNGANDSAGQTPRASSQPSAGGQVPRLPLWIFGLLDVLAAMFVASIVWISRRPRGGITQQDSRSGQTTS